MISGREANAKGKENGLAAQALQPMFNFATSL